MRTVELQIPNMQSGHCQMRVRGIIEKVEGTRGVEVSAGRAEVVVDNDAQLETIVKDVTAGGYTVLNTNVAAATEGSDMMFSTNINCGSCVADVKPALDAASGITNWTVDTTSAQKTLTVSTIGITEEQVMTVVRNAGFEIQPINA